MIKLNASKWFVRLFFLIYSAFIVILFYALNFSHIYIVPGVILIFISSFFWILNSQSKWRGLLPSNLESGWKIWDKFSHSYEVSLLPGSYCSHYMLILNFHEKTKNKKISLMIFRDSVSTEEFKRTKMHMVN